jgi:hypothetical protein
LVWPKFQVVTARTIKQFGDVHIETCWHFVDAKSITLPYICDYAIVEETLLVDYSNSRSYPVAVCIFASWNDARFGTIANAIIVIAIIFGWGDSSSRTICHRTSKRRLIEKSSRHSN